MDKKWRDLARHVRLAKLCLAGETGEAGPLLKDVFHFQVREKLLNGWTDAFLAKYAI
jgi:hypothetical protein